MAFYATDESWNSGAVHLAEGDDAAKDLLLVFVHGIFTNYKDTWTNDRRPEDILNKSDLDADVLVFSHPSRLYHQASVEASATMLRHRIATAFPGRTHRNVVFLTHSLGGLVVKRMLCDEADAAWQSLQPDSLGSLESQSLWSRTRLVINIDTPHMGGNVWLALLYPVYAVTVRPVVCSLSWIPVYCRLQCWPWGSDRQLQQLRTGCKFVSELEKHYRQWCRKFSAAKLPSPVRFEFPASVMNTINRVQGLKVVFDRATEEVATVPEFDQYEREVPGDHGDAIAHAIKPCANVLKKYFQNFPAYSFAERTLSFLLYTKDLRVDLLLEPQQAMLNSLIGEVGASPSALAPRVIVLEADAGLGKSTVVRALSRYRALSRLKYSHGAKVILVEMHRLPTTATLTTAAEVWQEVINSFCDVTNALAPYRKISPAWLGEELVGSQVLLILDGIEEFLMNAPGVSREAALGITKHIQATCSKNGGLVALVTLRTSWFTEYERTRVALGTVPRRLGEPTDENLQRVFPFMEEILKRTASAPPEARRLIRSPLFASLLRTTIPLSPEMVATWNFESEADVYEFALFARTSTMRLPGVGEATLREIARVLGWEMFCRWGNPVSMEDLRKAAWKRAVEWYKHVQNLGHQALSESAAAAAEPVFRSSSMAERRKNRRFIRDDVIPAVLRRTVFTAFDDVRFRPMHREIQDYLAASYLARCIQFRKFQDLGERGGNVRVFQLAAQRIDRVAASRQDIFTPQLVQELWDAKVVDGRRSRITFGHVAVVVANSKTECSRDFFVTLIAKLREMDELARHISFGGLCYRMLRNNSHDRELHCLLRDELKKYAEGEEFAVDVITRSMAWCNLRATSATVDAMNTLGWEDLKVAENALPDASRVFFGPPNEGFLDEKLTLAHQVAFEQLLATFERDEHRPISVAHFLLGLAAGYRDQERLTNSLQTAIRVFFANKQSPGYQRLVNYSKVPELKNVVELAEGLL